MIRVSQNNRVQCEFNPDECASIMEAIEAASLDKAFVASQPENNINLLVNMATACDGAMSCKRPMRITEGQWRYLQDVIDQRGLLCLSRMLSGIIMPTTTSRLDRLRANLQQS